MSSLPPVPATPERPPRVRVVVLNWNAHWFSSRCLRAVLRTDHPPASLDVVVVDNGSIDGSLERLRDEFPTVRFIATGANLGFAEGCNRAMRDLDDIDHVALVNNDAVPEPGWLSALLAALDAAPRAGAAAACLVLEPAFTEVRLDLTGGTAVLEQVLVDGIDATARAQVSGARSQGRTEWPMEVVHHLEGPARLLVPAGEHDPTVTIVASGTGQLSAHTAAGSSACTLEGGAASVELVAGSDRVVLLNGLGTDRNDENEAFDRHFGVEFDPAVVPELALGAREVPGFCGGGVLLRADMLREVGLFDPSFFAYYEDTDLSWRASRAGWSTVTAPDAVIRHAFGGSGGALAPGFFFLNYRNWLLTVIRNGEGPERRRALRSVYERVKWTARANVAGALRRGRRPSFLLLGAWLRTLSGVVAVLVAHRIRRPVGPPGARGTDRVHGALQPRFTARPPAVRPAGPSLVHLDLTDDLATARAGTQLAVDERPAVVALRGLAIADPRLDLVPVVRVDDRGGLRRASPREVGSLLGTQPAGLDVDVADLQLALLPGAAVLRFRDDGTPEATLSTAASGAAAAQSEVVRWDDADLSAFGDELIRALRRGIG